MRARIYFASMMWMVCMAGSYGQGSIDFVYGSVGYEQQSGVEITYTFGYPVIDIMQNDDRGIITAGIPPIFIAGGTVPTYDRIPLEGITIFPNPVGSVLNVQRESIGESWLVQLFDVNGVVLQSINCGKGDKMLQLQTDNLISGHYFLNVTQNENLRSTQFKIIKLK